jgi:hypothetical protein
LSADIAVRADDSHRNAFSGSGGNELLNCSRCWLAEWLCELIINADRQREVTGGKVLWVQWALLVADHPDRIGIVK